MRKSKQEKSSRVKRDKLSLLATGKYFESATLIGREKIYFIFMSVCHKSFNSSHDFSKNAALVNLAIYQSIYGSFKPICF